MPVIDLPPPTAFVRPFEGFGQTSIAQGDDGIAVQFELNEMEKHWRQTECGAESSFADEGYRHVPLETVGRIRVRFRKATGLAPRTITTADDE